jgi:spermidine synthase
VRPGPFHVVFFLSGFTSLLLELVFHRLLGYVFGSSALAVTTVLVAFMGGLALGGAVLGRFADRVRRPALAYGVIELAVGAYALLVPLVFAGCQRLYVAAGISAQRDAPGHLALRFGLSALVLLVPTALMGGTLPLMARAFVRTGDDARRKLAVLYGSNTLGAACGVLLGNYLVLRYLGTWGALGLAALLDLSIFLRARRIQRGLPATVPREPETAPREGSIPWRAAAAIAFATGWLTFLFEIVWSHLLGTVVGSSVYAFGLMLFAVLVGMAAGSLGQARVLGRWSAARLVGLSQLALGTAVVVTLPLWDKLPHVFRVAGVFQPGFAVMELVRASVCLVILAVPCLAIGATFPALLESCAADRRRMGRRLGALYALNTLGCILGALATGFVLLERLGAQRTLALGGVGSALVGLGAWRVGGQRVNRAAALTAALAVAAVAIPRWNLQTLARGMNVYFDGGADPGEVVFVHEDSQGGFTTVSRDDAGFTLRTNGKFEGNDHDEVDAQYAFSLVPLLFTRGFGRALVIGYGTGATSGALSRFPFQQIEVAELSPGIVAADRYFRRVNFDVRADPRVRLFVDDGRNHLLLDPQRYDLISVEVTSVWFAGAGNLYNREFYQLARDRLVPGGVLQQWVQLHHIDRLDLWIMWNTLSRVFAHVSLWIRGGQGLLIATQEPQVIDYAHVAAMNASPAAAPLKARLVVPDFFSLLGDQALDPGAMKDLLSSWIDPRLAPLMISRDAYPYLEYATPQGNALRYAREANLKWIEAFDRRRLPQVSGVPDAAAARRLQLLVAFARGNCDRVLRLEAGDDPLLARLRGACQARLEGTDY